MATGGWGGVGSGGEEDFSLRASRCTTYLYPKATSQGPPKGRSRARLSPEGPVQSPALLAPGLLTKGLFPLLEGLGPEGSGSQHSGLSLHKAM